MPAFIYEVRPDGIAILTFDVPEEKVNKLTTAVMDELSGVLDELGAKKEIKALVFRSGKAESFIVGADIAEISKISAVETGTALARNGQAVFKKLETLPFPTVAAIHGPCMGGGMELALACTYRVISNDQKTALALPEVKLGIIPGFGGTQRLPRLVGLLNSLDMILTGKSVYSKKARKIGLADEVTYKELLQQRAIVLAQKAAGGSRLTRVRAKRPVLVRLIEGNPLTRHFIYGMARKNVLKETRGNYPAPIEALESVRYGMKHGREAGFINEAKLLGKLAPTEISKNLINVFYLNEKLKKDAGPPSLKVTKAGVLGAGVMGGGIAELLAEKGISVRMKDINTKAVGAGLREAWEVLKTRRKKGILTPIQARDSFDRITGATDYSGLEHVDVAIEAVVEDLEIKKSVLRDFEQKANKNTVFASNTSSLSIGELASASQQPDKVVGMHFFNPVNKMPLVEIVRGARTSEKTIAAIATLSRRLGKLPVIVNDGPGFLVNRVLMSYLGEAIALLEAGGTIEDIDGALLGFGMPMGAFILLDEIGIDIAHKVSEILYQGLGERVKPSGLLGNLHRDGYLGKKNGRGFYVYQGRKRSGPDASITGEIVQHSGSGKKLEPGDIVERAVLLMIKEASLCLEENIIDTPERLDAALIFGIGFPPFRGGLLRYADTLGIKTIVEKLGVYAKKHGERFSPPQSLIGMAARGEKFFP